jgi:hypothetical protein
LELVLVSLSLEIAQALAHFFEGCASYFAGLAGCDQMLLAIQMLDVLDVVSEAVVSMKNCVRAEESLLECKIASLAVCACALSSLADAGCRRCERLLANHLAPVYSFAARFRLLQVLWC